MKAKPISPFHPRNRHQGAYDFEGLVESYPPLAKHLIEKPEGGLFVNFADPQAVLLLNTAILHRDYGIENWSLPQGYLCPPVPGRADYVHALKDLVSEKKGSTDSCRILDIGTGAGAIYALLGASIYGWNMVASDINEDALENCRVILEANPALNSKIELRHQADPSRILTGIIGKQETFDATMCNPPFFDSEEAADLANLKKQEKHRSRRIPYSIEERTFQGRANERCCKGGERGFIGKLLTESQDHADRCGWFTSLVSRQSTLDHILPKLKATGIEEHRTIPMRHGNKASRILAWRYRS